jgi:pimeloyl-ACP methyl ester carboxylesterase
MIPTLRRFLSATLRSVAMVACAAVVVACAASAGADGAADAAEAGFEDGALDRVEGTQGDLDDREAEAAGDAPSEDVAETPSDLSSEEDATSTPFVPTITWSPCEVAKVDGECATVEVPLDWEDPAGPRILLFVQRLVGTRPGQVWALSGGPGYKGPAWTAKTFRDATGLTAYALDYRGTGQSTPLSCPEVTASFGWVEKTDAPLWQACGAALAEQWGEGLRHFSTKQAARDVIALATALRTGTEPLELYGVSFGTRWALRVLALAPDLFAGAVLDGLSSPDWSWTAHKVDKDAVAKRKLDAVCAVDPICMAKLGPDPYARLVAAMDKVRGGHCPTSAGLDLRHYQRLLWKADWATLAPLVYRLERCDPADQKAILRYLEYSHAFPEIFEDAAFSAGAHANVALNEAVFPDDPAVADLEAAEAAANVTEGEASAYRYLRDVWPVAPFDPSVKELPETAVPMLMLNGGLDGQTDLEQAEYVASHYAGPHQTFVAIAKAAHGIAGWTCADTMIHAFLADPQVPVEPTSCDGFGDDWTYELLRDPTYALSWFGTTDIWENP